MKLPVLAAPAVEDCWNQIGVRGDRIVAVGALENAKAGTIVDAKDRFVSPGFIDVHSHAGPGLGTEQLKHGQPVLAQGITTVLVNPDGGGPVDLRQRRGRNVPSRAQRRGCGGIPSHHPHWNAGSGRPQPRAAPGVRGCLLRL